MINSAISINLVKKFIPLCSTISTKQPCQAISLSVTKKFHVINLTHISNSNSCNDPYSTVTIRCSSEFPSRPNEDQPSIPTEIPKIDTPPEFESIPPAPEIIQQPTPEIPGPNPGPEFPGPPIPSPATPDIPLPQPDVVPPRPPTPREVPPPPSTPTPLDVPPPSSPPDIMPPPVGAFI